MSTVLWANRLLAAGEVASDESDKWALYKHAGKLDKLAKAAKLAPFSSLLDYTDMQYNLGDDELPEGLASTTALMARDGVWQPADAALVILNGLLVTIRSEKPRFGLLSNDYDAVVAELLESIQFAESANEHGARFNFSVVM